MKSRFIPRMLAVVCAWLLFAAPSTILAQVEKLDDHEAGHNLSSVAPSAAQEQATFGRGVKVFSDNCGRCHQAPSPTFKTDREWRTITLHMRVIANLSRMETGDVRAFLTTGNDPSSKVRDAVARLPDSGNTPVERGRLLVEQKNCVACHNPNSLLPNAPPLPGILSHEGPGGEQHARAVLKDPAKKTDNSPMPNFNFSQEEIEAVISYLKTLK